MPKKLPPIRLNPSDESYVPNLAKLKKQVSKKQYLGLMHKTSFNLPISLHKAFAIKARQDDTDMTTKVIEWIEDYIKE